MARTPATPSSCHPNCSLLLGRGRPPLCPSARPPVQGQRGTGSRGRCSLWALPAPCSRPGPCLELLLRWDEERRCPPTLVVTPCSRGQERSCSPFFAYPHCLFLCSFFFFFLVNWCALVRFSHRLSLPSSPTLSSPLLPGREARPLLLQPPPASSQTPGSTGGEGSLCLSPPRGARLRAPTGCGVRAGPSSRGVAV